MTQGGSSASRLENPRSFAVTSPSSSLLSFRADRLLSDTPLHLDVLPGRLAGEDLVEAQVELVLLRHLCHPPVRRFVLGEGNEDHLISLPGSMADQLDEETWDRWPDVPLPLLHHGIELGLLSWLEGGVRDGAEHCSLLSIDSASGHARPVPRRGPRLHPGRHRDRGLRTAPSTGSVRLRRA